MTQTLARSAMLLFATSALVVWSGDASAAVHHHHAARHSAHHHAAAKHEESSTYTVKSGDTLYSIAGKLGVSVEALKSANHLKGSALRVGQVLKVHAAAKESASDETASSGSERGPHETRSEAPASYKVRRGDTIAKVADKLGVSVAELKRANHLKGDAIRAGQVLKAPGAAHEGSEATPREEARREAAAEAPTTYKVRHGDTIAKVADKLGVSVAELKRANHLRHNALRTGQVLKVPGAARTSSEEASAPSSRHERHEERPATYKVRRGDTIGKIADKLGVSVAELKRANHLRHNRVRTGEVLKVPGAAAEEAAPSRETSRPAPEEATPPARVSRGEIGKIVEVEGPRRSHRVKRGDTLAKVARDLGMSEAELKRENHLRSSHLRRGAVLHGPASMVKAYVVGPGDTIYTISRRFDVSVERLRAENGLGHHGSIHTGQKLRLPPGYHDLGPAAGEFHPVYTPPPATTPPAQTAPSRGYVPPTTIPSAPPAAPTASPPPSDAQVSEMARGRFVWPLTGSIISDFGPKTEGQRNDGINIQANTGDPVHAAATGEVVYAGDQVPGFGNLVLIKHADGWVTAYGHLSRIEVKMQQKVTQGQEIGLAGSTGGVSQPQLHFEVRYAPSPMERARPVDPKLVLPH